MYKLLRYLKPYWLPALLAPLFMLVEVCMDLLQPRLMASIVDQGIMGGDMAHIRQTGLQMLGVALIGLVGGFGCTVFSSIAAQSFGTDLREALFRRVQSLSYTALDRFAPGTLVTRLTNDVTGVQMLVMMSMRILVRAPLLIVGSVVMVFTIDAKLALILLVLVPVLFAVLYGLIRLAFPLFARVQRQLDSVNGVLQENLAGIRVVKAFVRARFERDRFDRVNDPYMDAAIRATRAVALNMPVLSLLLNAGIVAVLWFGGGRVWSGALDVGELAAFLNYMNQVLFSLLMVGMMLVMFSRGKASAERIGDVLEQPPEQAASTGKQADRHAGSGVRGARLEFDRVAFAYGEGREVLTDISFVAESGSTVAILGATGAGKSSLVQLVPRFYDPASGRITLDGTDLRELDVGSLRRTVGIVQQQAILFSGTIHDNIAFGRTDATREEVVEAARAAQAHDFIAAMPDGYDTVIGQRGVTLSGGQKQRLSIARALLIRPSVLLLDDSTSAVDLATEARIRRALKERLQGTTVLLIAQRIASVAEADRILVLDGGRIVASGTHESLLATSAIYRDIYDSQSGMGENRYGSVHV